MLEKIIKTTCLTFQIQAFALFVHIICYNHTVHDNTQPHQLFCNSWRAGRPSCCTLCLC